MDLKIIIGIVVFIIAAIIIFKIVSKLLKALFFVSIIAGIILAIFGFFIYQDAMDLKENFPVKDKLFLLEENGKYLTGVVMGSFEDKEEQQFKVLTKEQIDSYKGKKDKEIIGEYYKMLIFKTGAFSDIKEISFIEGQSFNVGFILELLKSENVFSGFVEKMIEQQEEYKDLTNEQKKKVKDKLVEKFKEQFKAKDDSEMKGFLFGMLFAGAVTEKGPVFISQKYQDGNITIYPETIIFKTLKKVPMKSFEKVFDKIPKLKKYK